ncbi:hypothetical protein OAL10_04005 [Gammaproteobacteria bacterium]|nr:hypothetical protein [Gammaproteobacteria bacterium]
MITSLSIMVISVIVVGSGLSKGIERIAKFMMSFNALLIALITSWAINSVRLHQDIGIKSDFAWRAWQLSTRLLAPIAVTFVFLFNVLN